MKKILRLVTLSFLLALLVSCNKKQTYEDFRDLHVKVNNSFNIQRDDYYLYFYTEQCKFCNDLKPLVFKQANKGEIPLYFVSQKELGAALNMTTDKNHSNTNVTKFKDLKLYGFPTMMLLRDGRVIQEFVGYTAINKELKG